MRTFCTIAAVVFGLTVAGTALAGEPDTEIIYRKHQIETFGDDTVDGDLARPGTRIDSRRGEKTKSLIRVRMSFRPEILKSLPR